MAYGDKWDEIRPRYEAFWQGDRLERPLLQLTAPDPNGPAPILQDSAPEEPDRLFDWYMDADLVIPRLQRELARRHYGGEAIPTAFPVSPSLVGIQAAYLGGEYQVAADTAWCGPIIDDWATRPPLRLEDDNKWWSHTLRLLARGAADLHDQAAVGIPDLQGDGQILALLRGSERLATDLIEFPWEVHQALREVDDVWWECWQQCNDRIIAWQDGYIDWLGVWSEEPAVTVECDFSIMISPEMFREFFLPSIQRQTELVDRTIYHLDGEGAVKHLDALLELETLDGIQWTPGAGARPMIEYLSLLQRIQHAGKRLVIDAKPEELVPIARELDPRGLLISSRCRTLDEAEALVREVESSG